MTQFSISDMAKEFGVTLRTLRFYEGRGLISPIREGSARVYSEAERERLRRILGWTEQGFTLSEIKEALGRGGFPPEKLAEQLEHLRRRRIETDCAIEEIKLELARHPVAA